MTSSIVCSLQFYFRESLEERECQCQTLNRRLPLHTHRLTDRLAVAALSPADSELSDIYVRHDNTNASMLS